MYGLKINDTLDISAAKSMILVEVITLDNRGNLSFRYGDVFTSVGQKQVDRWGFNASYLMMHSKGTLVPFIRAKQPLADCKKAGIPNVGSTYASVDAGNIDGGDYYPGQDMFLVNFINNVSPAVDIYVYEAISNKYEETDYGMNIYDELGDVTFSTRRPILSDVIGMPTPNWYGAAVANAVVPNSAVFAGMTTFHIDQYGMVGDKYAFSPMVTADDKVFTGLSMFQGASPLMGQTETPTFDFLSKTALLARI